MDIQNTEKFDFTEMFSGLEIYDYLKNGLAAEIENITSRKVLVDFLMLNGFDKVLACEMNGKWYKSSMLVVRNNSDCYRDEYVVTITPFNVHVRKFGKVSTDLTEENRSIELTKLHRRKMQEAFGAEYVASKKEFIEELKQQCLEDENEKHLREMKNIENRFAEDFKL